MVIVIPVHIAVHAVSHIQIELSRWGQRLVLGSDRRRYGDAVDSGAGKTVVQCRVCNIDLGCIVGASLLHAHSLEHIARFRFSTQRGELVNIDYGDIEHRLCDHVHAQCLGDALADLVILAFEWRIYLAAYRVECHRSEMSLDSVNGAENVPLHIDFHESAREWHVHTVLLFIVCDTLHMLGLLPHIYFARKIGLRGFLRLAAGHAEHGSHGQKYVCVSFHIVYNFI